MAGEDIGKHLILHVIGKFQMTRKVGYNTAHLLQWLTVKTLIMPNADKNAKQKKVSELVGKMNGTGW